MKVKENGNLKMKMKENGSLGIFLVEGILKKRKKRKEWSKKTKKIIFLP